MGAELFVNVINYVTYSRRFNLNALLSQTGLNLVDESDRKWYTRENQQFVSLNQEGPIPGHYMQVDGESVFTNALEKNQNSKFHHS